MQGALKGKANFLHWYFVYTMVLPCKQEKTQKKEVGLFFCLIFFSSCILKHVFLNHKIIKTVVATKTKSLLKSRSGATLQYRKYCRSMTPADIDREQRKEFVHDLSNNTLFPLLSCSGGATTAGIITAPQEKM